jgi:hypothetical protein
VFIDAIVVKVRDGQVANRPICAASGVSLDGERDILGPWAGTGSEGAIVLDERAHRPTHRGVKDVFFLVCDGLKGLPEVVGNVWPQTIVQTSSVHTARCRDGLAGHRTIGRGPMQTCAFEARMQTCPSRWRRAAQWPAGVALRAP